MNCSTNRAILKLNSNELHFVRHNTDLKKTGSFPNSLSANFVKLNIKSNADRRFPSGFNLMEARLNHNGRYN